MLLADTKNDSKIKKPTKNVSTIGHIDHGKTTLTSAITKVCSERNLGKYHSYDQIDSAKEERARGITINAAHITYETEKFFYIHTDCPGHADYVKNCIVGTSATDIAILVISAADGVMPQTKEHIILVSRTKVPHVVVYLNKMDVLEKSGDTMLAALVEEEVRDLLSKNGYNNPIFIEGTAFGACNDDTGEYGKPSVAKLLEILDSIPAAKKDPSAPLTMQVEDTCSITGRGTVATGRILQGTARIGDNIEVIGGPHVIKTVITSIEMFRSSVTMATPGDDIGLLLRGGFKRGKGDHSIARGMLVCAPGTIRTATKARCEMYVLSSDDGGRRTGFHVKYSPQMFIRSGNVTISIDEIADQDILNPGELASVVFSLQRPTPLKEGDSVIFREGGRTIAAGVISEIL